MGFERATAIWSALMPAANSWHVKPDWWTDQVDLFVEGPRAVAKVGDIAIAEAALEGDWIGVHGLSVGAERRRTGLARALMAELLDWGGSLGATTTWLHVETDNQAAIALYEAMNYRVHHSSRYFKAPSEASE